MVHNILLAARQTAAKSSSEQDEVAKYMMKFANFAYPNIAAQIIILMEAIRTIPAEIRMYRRAFRRGRLNAAESLFLTIKYVAIMAWTCNALIENSSYLPNILTCKVVHTIFYYGMFLDVFFVAVAIAWRTYVIFQCSRKAYWILCVCLAAHLSMSLFSAHRQHKASALIGGFCTVLPYEPILMSHMSVPYFLAFNVIFDATITAASSYRLVSSARNLNGLSRISRVLFNNNVHYAAIVCTVNFAEFIYMVTGDYKRRSLLNVSCALQVIACLNLLINEQDVVHDAAPAYVSRNRTMSEIPGSRSDKTAASFISRKGNVDALEKGRIGGKECVNDMGTRNTVIGVNCVVEQHSSGDLDVEYGIAKGSGEYSAKSFERHQQSKHVKHNSWSASPTSASTLFRAQAQAPTSILPQPDLEDGQAHYILSPVQATGASSLTFPIRLPSYDDLRHSQNHVAAPHKDASRPSTGLSIKSIRANMAFDARNGGHENSSSQKPRTQQASRQMVVNEQPTQSVTRDHTQSSTVGTTRRDGSKSSTGSASTSSGRTDGTMAHLAPYYTGSTSLPGLPTTDKVAHTSSEVSSDCQDSVDRSVAKGVTGISSPALCHLWQSKRGDGPQANCRTPRGISGGSQVPKKRSQGNMNTSYLDM